VSGQREDLLVARMAKTLPSGSAEELYGGVVEAKAKVAAHNSRAEPRVVVSTVGEAGASVYKMLREDKRVKRAREWPLAVTHQPVSTLPQAQYVSLSDLLSELALAWKEGWLRFAPELKELQGQVVAFATTASKTGAIQLPDQDQADNYHEQVIALAYAVRVRRWALGQKAHVDSAGTTWPSKLIARAKVGARA